MQQVYETETFWAQHIEDDSFQVGINGLPVILSFNYSGFNNLRKDLSRLRRGISPELEFYRDFEAIRVYTAPKEELIYILFKELGWLCIGLDEDDFYSFVDDAINLNPEAMLEKKKEEA